jgi:hypothetical protein
MGVVSHRAQREHELASPNRLPHQHGGHVLSLTGLANSIGTYDKLTLEIRHYKLGVPLQLSSPEVKLYYSRGTAAFVSRADGVFSSRASGTLVIEEKGESHLLIKIDAEIVPQPARQDLPFLRREK